MEFFDLLEECRDNSPILPKILLNLRKLVCKRTHGVIRVTSIVALLLNLFETFLFLICKIIGRAHAHLL